MAARGFCSKGNRRFLQQGGGASIIGEKLRSGSAEAKTALSRQGRYKTVAGTQVKEVRLPDARDRFIICFDPDQAVRDAAVRVKMISVLEEVIARPDSLIAVKRAKLCGRISTMPGLNWIPARHTPGGLLRTDLGKAKTEENLDGKYLLRSADSQMSAEDTAAGYKQLLEVERDRRDMKSILDLRRVFHRLEERIRAHVILCWLALLLIRVAEDTAAQAWPTIRRELQCISLGTFTDPADTFRQRTDIPKTARGLLTALDIDVPRKIHELNDT